MQSSVRPMGFCPLQPVPRILQELTRPHRGDGECRESEGVLKWVPRVCSQQLGHDLAVLPARIPERTPFLCRLQQPAAILAFPAGEIRGQSPLFSPCLRRFRQALPLMSATRASSRLCHQVSGV